MAVRTRLWLLLHFLVAVNTTAHAEWFIHQKDLMGTRISVEVEHDDALHAQTCAHRVFEEMARIDQLMSSYRPTSEVSRINQFAGQGEINISPELSRLIEKSLHFSRLSQGAFDISYASIGHRYDYRRRIKPDDQTIDDILPLVDYQDIKLNRQEIRLEHPGMRIDLGGIAKGYAVDRAIAVIGKCNIQNARVSAGGDTRIMGDRSGRPWIIGIRHPRREKHYALRIPLFDVAFSTSGDYERFFISNGERIHHIINPRTGKSATSSWSSTVIGADATSTDALSTTLFILGAQKGIDLINTIPEFDAIIIDGSGQVHYSSGLASADPQSSRNSGDPHD